MTDGKHSVTGQRLHLPASETGACLSRFRYMYTQDTAPRGMKPGDMWLRSEGVLVEMDAAGNLVVLESPSLSTSIEWRCFHCNEVFTHPDNAKEHFGGYLDSVPACKIAGHEGHLITYIRKLEADLAEYRSESDSLTSAWHARDAEHQQAVRRAEEEGYNKGVRDMRDPAITK